MDHNEFEFIEDLVKPFKDFIKRIQNEQHDQITNDDNNLNLKLINDDRTDEAKCLT